MAIIIMTSVQTEQAFHSIPKKIGYYQTQDIKIVNEKVVTKKFKLAFESRHENQFGDVKFKRRNSSFLETKDAMRRHSMV